MPRSSFEAPTPDETLEVFRKPAGWMLHWGISSVVLLLVVFIALAAFVQYPDKVELEVTISTIPPPVPVVCRTAGTVEQLFVVDGSDVESGQAMLLLHSRVAFEDVIYLDSILELLQEVDAPIVLSKYNFKEPLRLGEMGLAYTQLLNTSAEIKAKLKRQSTLKQLEQLDAQIKEQEVSQANLNDQTETLRLELAIAERNLKQFEELLRRESASQIEVDQSATRFLGVQRRLEEQQNRLSQTRSRIAQLAGAKLQLKLESEEAALDLWLQWKAQLRNLQHALMLWEDDHLLRATADGKLTLFEELSQGSPLREQQIPFGIIPENNTLSYRAEGLLPDLASGSIGIESEAYLEVLAFPAQRYGKLKATVLSIAEAPQQNGSGYRVVLQLPDGLRTTYDQDLSLRQQMSAKASILTEKRSLLGRLFESLRKQTIE